MNKLAKDTHELQIDMRTMADRLERRARRVRMVRPNDSIAYEWCTAADTLRRLATKLTVSMYGQDGGPVDSELEETQT